MVEAMDPAFSASALGQAVERTLDQHVRRNNEEHWRREREEIRKIVEASEAQ